MKNSKGFSAKSWLHNSFLSDVQLGTCRATFPDDTSRLALSVIDLPLLSADLMAKGPSLTEHYLDQAEQERLAALTFAKRHIEWLGGRIAVKKAAMALLTSPPSTPRTTNYKDLRIESAASGRPYLTHLTEAIVSLPEISISHSGNFAGGLAVTGRPCGLDLQRITSKVLKIRGRMASSEELDLLYDKLPSHDESIALSLLWSAKESFRKAFTCQPLVGFTELTLQSLTGDLRCGMVGHFSCPRVHPSLLPVILTIKDNVACAITVLH